MSVTYNGTNYYYATNLQGDVTAILNTSGTAVVQYTYDAWGKLLTTTGSMASTLGVYNPLRYRGYVYDEEYALYYLQSRYYDPLLGRFLNADALVSTGQGLLGNNMFAYCGNNPVSRVDIAGNAWVYVIEDTETKVVDESDGKTTYETKITYSRSRTGKFLWISLDKTESEKVVTFRYTISNNGAIAFDNTQTDAAFITDKAVRDKLAEEMYNICTNSVEDSLSKRTVEGISSELLWHYRLRKTGPGTIANIGGRGKNVLGRDTNAWIFEIFS